MARLNDTATDTSARSNFKKQSSTFSLTAIVTPEHAAADAVHAAADAVHQLDLTITSPYFHIFLCSQKQTTPSSLCVSDH